MSHQTEFIPLKVLVAPDSFKGTLTSQQVAIALTRGLQQVLPKATILQCPLADGGEGTLVSLQAVLGGRLHYHTVVNAVGHPQTAAVYCCEIEGRSAAVLEVAQVVSITDLDAMQHSVRRRTTLGLGQLIKWTLDQGIRSIYIGLGGSCTNDGGAGLLVGLGARLLDRDGTVLVSHPEGLAQLAQVDLSGLDPRLPNSQIVLLSDVNSPLCGPQGSNSKFKILTEKPDILESESMSP